MLNLINFSKAVNVSGNISADVCLPPESSWNSEAKPGGGITGLGPSKMYLQTFCFSEGRGGAGACWGWGGAGPVPVPCPLSLWEKSCHSQIWFLPTRFVWWPQDKLQSSQINGGINRSYIKANNKPSWHLQVLPQEEVPRCQGRCDPCRVTRVVDGQAGKGTERWDKPGGKPLCWWLC